MKKALCAILSLLLVFAMLIPAAAADSFDPVKINVTGQGTGEGVFRFITTLSSFPFAVTENSLTGCKITGTWTHKKTGEVVQLDSTIKANEMRDTSTVLVVYETDTVKVSDIDYTTNNEYTFDFTVSPPDEEAVIIDETNFEPFELKVTGTGSASGVKRIVVSTANFPFAVITANQLENCLLNGKVTYAGTDPAYSPEVPFENVKVVRSDVRSGATAIDFVVPEGYTIMDSNSGDSLYTWELTLSPGEEEEIITDLPETGTTFFVTPQMFKTLGTWAITNDATYEILFSGEKVGNDTSVAIKIPEAGTYGIYSYTKDYADNSPGSRYAQIQVGGVLMQDAGKHGQTGYAWEKIGEVTFEKDQTVKVSFLKSSAPYSRTAALMFTTEQEYRPSEECFQYDLEAAAAETTYMPLSDAQSNVLLLPDDFSTDMGTWIKKSDGGYTILEGLSSKTTDAKEASAKIEIPADGVYYVWGLAKDYSAAYPGTRSCKIGVNGAELPNFIGVHGLTQDTGTSGAYRWDMAGRVTLKQGAATISLLDVNRYYARVAAVLLTTDPDFGGLPDNTDLSELSAKYHATVYAGQLDFSGLKSYGNKLSFTLKNRTDETLEKGVIVAAIYDENGVLVNTKTQQIETPLAAGQSLDPTEITFEAASEWTNGKVMLWESWESMKPLCPAETFVYVPEDYANPDEDAGLDYGTVTSYMLNYTFANENYAGKEFNIRGGIYNTLKKLQDGEDVTIAYLGGSITQQNTWRTKTTEWFEDTYAGNIKEVNIGLSGTGADLAVCRIDKDILAYDPDLVFIEYAVNGGQANDMEGMVLKVWEKDPTIDICFVYTTTTSNYSIYARGDLPSYAAIYENVAAHYNVPAVFFAYQPFDLYEQGKLTLSGSVEPGKVLYTTDGIHPTLDGGWLAAGAIARCVIEMEKTFDAKNYTIQNHTIPAQTYDPYPWKDADYSDDWSLMKFDGTWLDCSLDTNTNNFKNYSYTGGYIDNFKQMFPNMTGTVVPGSSVTIKFKGTDLGVFEAGGQYSGQLRVIIDGVESDKMVLYNNNDSKLRHQYYFIPTQEYGEHTVTFILDETMPDKSYLQSQHPADTTYEKNELYLGKILVVGEILDANE